MVLNWAKAGMVIYIGFAALRLWFHDSIEQVAGCDNILIVRFDKQTRILKQRPS
jgi:hypothetical protein